MKTLLVLIVLLFSPAQPLTQSVPPGLREAQRAEDRAQRNEVPPQVQRLGPDPDKLKRDAEELASLAQSIPKDINQATKGILPGDLAPKLKKIEKLAKELRSQLTR